MKQPCDDVGMHASSATAPCAEKSRPWVLAATILGSSMAFIDSTVVNVALPALQSSFHATVADVQWVIEAYGVLLAALILVGGSLGDFFGRRLTFVSGVAIFALASCGCGIAQSIGQLILARSAQGIGAALLVPGSLAIISASFDEKSRGQAIGTWSGFTAMMTALGPVLGGWLIEHASWRWVFFINVPLAAVVIAISLWRVPENRESVRANIDWNGALAATLGLGGLVNGFIESESEGWRHPLVLLSLALGCVFICLFFWIEARVRSPIVPLALFRSSSFSGANLLTLFLYGAIGIFFFLFPLNLIQVQKYSATATGAALLPLILIIFVLSRWSGGLVAKYGSRLPLTIGPLVAASGFLLFAFTSVSGNYWTSFFPAVMVLGLGMAITVAPLTTVVMNSIPQDRAGAASGINNAVARVAGVLAIAVFGIVMVKAFGWQLSRSLAHSSLPAQILGEIQSREIDLAAMQPPAGLNPDVRAFVRQSIDNAFVFGFRIVALLCGALSLASCLVAWLMIPKNPGRILDAGNDQMVLPESAGPTRST
jgi:EmrB/QacA subfamily drug resistance transporter